MNISIKIRWKKCNKKDTVQVVIKKRDISTLLPDHQLKAILIETVSGGLEKQILPKPLPQLIWVVELQQEIRMKRLVFMLFNRNCE